MEYGLFATAVIRLASLGDEWESRLDTLLDADGDDSPTFRGTPKRLDVALAEEIKATLLTGRGVAKARPKLSAGGERPCEEGHWQVFDFER